MFEKEGSPLLPKRQFFKRVFYSFILAIAIVVVSVLIGMFGYRFFEDTPWINAFLDSTMTVSGVGAFSELRTSGGKIFAGLFALYGSFVLVVTVSIVLAPIIHRLLHSFHADDDGDPG